jgi:hypothetical protein
MPSENAHLKPVAELVSLARSHTRQVLALETRQSYPIPVHPPDGLRVEFLYCTQRAKPGSLQLVSPEYLLIIHAASGQLEPLKKVTPRDFGQSDSEGAFIGEHKLPPGMTYEESLSQEQRLYHDYDVLLPAFADISTDVLPEVRTAAPEFKALFEKLAERPLMPYYQVIGKDFFAWLDKVIAGRT